MSCTSSPYHTAATAFFVLAGVALGLAVLSKACTMPGPLGKPALFRFRVAMLVLFVFTLSSAITLLRFACLGVDYDIGAPIGAAAFACMNSLVAY